MPVLSIVVPIYKVEKYFERCIQSILAQSLRDIEIILVDDGSPDKCPELCDKYALLDSRIKVIHKRNGGLSSARNAGIRIASGDYIGFIDSDDDVDYAMYEKMYEKAIKFDVDFVMCDYIRIDDNGVSILKSSSIRGGYYTRNDICNNIFPSLIMGKNLEYGPLLSVWQCIYKNKFLKNFSIYFDEDVKWSEDNIFSSKVGLYASSFYYLKNEGLYHYYKNPDTITTGYRNEAWNVYLCMNRHLHELFDKVHTYNFEKQLNWHLIYYSCNCLGMLSTYLNKQNAKIEILKMLNNAELQLALKKDICTLDISIKLKLQLYLMKYKIVSILLTIAKRRRGNA